MCIYLCSTSFASVTQPSSLDITLIGNRIMGSKKTINNYPRFDVRIVSGGVV